MNNIINASNYEDETIECIGLDYFEDEASPEDMYGRGEPTTDDPDGPRVVYLGASDCGLFHWMKKHNVLNAEILCDGGAIIAASTLDYEKLNEAVEEIRARGVVHWAMGLDVDGVDQFVVYRAGLTPEQREMANENIIHALEVLNTGEKLHAVLNSAIAITDRVDIVDGEVTISKAS